MLALSARFIGFWSRFTFTEFDYAALQAILIMPCGFDNKKVNFSLVPETRVYNDVYPFNRDTLDRDI